MSPKASRRDGSSWPFLLLLVVCCVPSLSVTGAGQTEPERGLQRVDPRWHALTHATIVVEPGTRITDGTVVIRDGVIVSVTPGGPVPEGARAWDMTGLTIYPGLVEAHLPVDAPLPPETRTGLHWNRRLVAPERSALDGGGPDAETRKALRALGFTVAGIAPKGGIFRGSTAVVALGEDADEMTAATPEVLRRDVWQEISLETVRGFGRAASPGDADKPRYPTSQMGALAVLRQTLSDAEWHDRCGEVYARDPSRHEPLEPCDALHALGKGGRSGVTLLFDGRDELEHLRVVSLAQEFSRSLVLLGSGTEFRRLPGLVRAGNPLVVPLVYPDRPDVATPESADRVSLRELMTWEEAPSNVARLLAAGLTVAVTTDKLANRTDFYGNLAKASARGVEEDAWLRALTLTPAELMGVADRVGKIQPGMLANLAVVDGPLFVKKPKIRDVWVLGRRFEVEAKKDPIAEGSWKATLATEGNVSKDVEIVVAKGKVTLKHGEKDSKTSKVKIEEGRVSFVFDGKELGTSGIYRVSARVDGAAMEGTQVDAAGFVSPFSAVKQPDKESKDDAPRDATARSAKGEDEVVEDDSETASSPPSSERRGNEPLPVPLGAYGARDGLPPQQTVLIQNATVWTCTDASVLKNGVVLISGGKILYVGDGSAMPEIAPDVVIDALGRHVTPGLIDCHSHTGISGGVNEMGQRVTAEVRIADVINPDDINWYRQLAGGLTAANQLHGSANAIGGQNSVVKLRWGAADPGDLKFKGAKPGIKFALGENPKRVAAGTEIADEYPKSRMGVEALIRDRLTAGREYRAAWDRYHGLEEAERSTTLPPRRDLELEALGQIVASERWIHCHSYRQDEIFMLCQMADQFGFKLGTLQHVLEGYKVAEAIKQSAIGASTFSDWWAYKFEVIDAIPHNAALMTEVGVNVSINSDSSDHARRLNTEAGKAMKYGGLSAEAALKLVTINPAIQLGVSDRTGSLERGKDADLVLWSGPPLSYASRCEATYVDGRLLFSVDQDRALLGRAEAERNRIIQVILRLDQTDPGDKKGGGKGREEEHDHEDELGSGAAEHRPGECGCGHVEGGR